MSKKKLLWVGDAGVPSGFARATHAILEVLHEQYDVTVLAVNYRGDPTGFPEFLRGRMWAAAPGGDAMGIRRLIWMCDMVEPDVIIIQNDGWNIPFYINQLRQRKSTGDFAFTEHAMRPVIAVVAVDGKNFDGKWLTGVAHAIFWTQFALDEAREGGYKGSAEVIPLGVDLTTFYPAIDRRATREHRLPKELWDVFIVGNVNRNQPRKRWDLMVKYFAEWINSTGIRDAYLYLHTAPTGDMGCDVRALAAYYGVVDRLALVTPEVFYGVEEKLLVETYNCFDVNASTTQGEGFGLTTLEAMACGVPCLAPDWSALGDWARDGALLIPCTTTHIGPPYVNVIGGVVDETGFIAGLNRLYRDEAFRKEFARAALALAEEPRYRWDAIGHAYDKAIQGCLEVRTVLEKSEAPHLTRKVIQPTGHEVPA